MRDASARSEARLLVVDDEPTILELLAGTLRFAGFDVLTAVGGAEALRAAAAAKPDLILLDVMMPGCDGFDVIRRIRAGGPRVPVIFLTARDSVHERVTGLSLGGDDYVTKPFSLDEVLARIRAVLRRTTGPQRATEAPRVTFADIELDEESHEVIKAGSVIPLSPTEFKLLRYLMANSGRVLSKAQILDHVWNYDFNGEANVVESYISYLRRKIDTTEPRLLQTIRGVGYTLRLPRGM
jgi:two-component system OmpR family response regulator